MIGATTSSALQERLQAIGAPVPDYVVVERSALITAALSASSFECRTRACPGEGRTLNSPSRKPLVLSLTNRANGTSPDC